MALFNITNKNVKFTIIDSDNTNFDENDCVVEIHVHRNFFRSILRDLSITNDSTQERNINLTRRERQVLKYLSDGINNHEIAKRLNVSIHTTKVHIHNIFNKLEVQDRTEAVVKAIKYNLIKI